MTLRTLRWVPQCSKRRVNSMVPTAPLIAALGEEIVVTPHTPEGSPPAEAQTVRGIVGRAPMLINEERDVQVNLVTIDLPATPEFRRGAAVRLRGRDLMIFRILQGDDPGWTRYECAPAAGGG